jgi:hypothetical protein
MKYYQFRNRIHVTKLFYKLEYVSYLIWRHGRFTTYMSGATIIIKFSLYHPLEVIVIYAK